MKHIGIVAEYNPFHKGHLYQIEQLHQQFPHKKILVMMSGDYVQRGEPAIFNKYLRSQCALTAGVDIILELPPIFATASAEYFASAAILSLHATGVIDTLCFGAEHTVLADYITLADVLNEEPAAYKQLLKEHLAQGEAFPIARSHAVCTYLHRPDYAAILNEPNNILALEYVKTIRKYKLPITPYIIKRQGADYHALTLDEEYCSASALRHALLEHSDSIFYSHVPSVTEDIYRRQNSRPLTMENFYPMLQYALWNHQRDLTDYVDISQQLSNRLNAMTSYPPTEAELIAALSCKNYTQTRIQRALLNLLLKNKKEDLYRLKASGYVSYLRLLGFQREAAPVLKDMKQHSSVLVINKVADSRKQLSPTVLTDFQNALAASTLYQQVYNTAYHTCLPSEYQHSVIIADGTHTIN